MKKGIQMGLLALVLAVSGQLFAQTQPAPTTAPKATPEQAKVEEACKGLQGTEWQKCVDAQKAKEKAVAPTTTATPKPVAQPAQ